MSNTLEIPRILLEVPLVLVSFGELKHGSAMKCVLGQWNSEDTQEHIKSTDRTRKASETDCSPDTYVWQ